MLCPVRRPVTTLECLVVVRDFQKKVLWLMFRLDECRLCYSDVQFVKNVTVVAMSMHNGNRF